MWRAPDPFSRHAGQRINSSIPQTKRTGKTASSEFAGR